LNLYGFRKIRTDKILLSKEEERQSKWWRFKHENFLRGRPDLLRELKKTNQLPQIENDQEIENLKQEVSHLRAEMGKLSAVVHQMSSMLQQGTGCDTSSDGPLHKKRKFVADHGSSPVLTADGPMQWLEPLLNLNGCEEDALHPESASDADLLLEDAPVAHQPGLVPPLDVKVRRSTSADFVESMFDLDKNDTTVSNDVSTDSSFGAVASPISTDWSPVCDRSVSHGDDSASRNQLDLELASKLEDAVSLLPESLQASFVFDGGTDAQPDSTNSSSVFNRSVSQSDVSTSQNQLESELASKLEDAVSLLPKSLQASFVERLVETIVSPESYRKHVDAVSVLATAAAIDAQNRAALRDASEGMPQSDETESASGLSANRHTLPVAAAALGAFLAAYGSPGRR